MEFSRQEHWRGLPFPSPGKEARKVRKLQLAVDCVCAHTVLTPSCVFCYLSLSQQWCDVISHLHKRKWCSVLLLVLHLEGKAILYYFVLALCFCGNFSHSQDLWSTVVGVLLWLLFSNKKASSIRCTSFMGWDQWITRGHQGAKIAASWPT